jgi:hypothetical protein
MAQIQSFDKETVERIARTVRQVLGDDKRRRPERRRKNHIGSPAKIKIAVLDGDLAHGGSATASVYIANAGTESDTGENVTVYDFDMIGSGNEIVATTKVFIANVNGYWYVINAAACATPV